MTSSRIGRLYDVISFEIVIRGPSICIDDLVGMLLFKWFVATVHLFAFGYGDLTCKDEHGSNVDWFSLYKLPRLRESTDENVQQGLGFISVTNAKTKKWMLHEENIASENSPPGQTLKTVYSEPHRKSLIYVFYNDEHPNGPTSLTLGHTKGVVAFDGTTGIWLVHSVPHFPPPPEQSYGYPKSGEHFGQSFLCLTLNISQVENVAMQLLYNQPYIYSAQLYKDLEDRYPLMKQVVNKEFRRQSPWYNVVSLVTLEGNSFISFAKSGKFNKELYFDWVAPALRANLMTETWRNGPHKEQIPSQCSQKFNVQNIENLKATAESSRNNKSIDFLFRNSQDHSKWAVSSDHSNPWLCIGDINRMTTQEVRGGGTVCTRNQHLWTFFAQMIKTTEPCTN